MKLSQEENTQRQREEIEALRAELSRTEEQRASLESLLREEQAAKQELE